MSNFFRSPIAWGVTVVLAFGGGAAYWVFENHQQRERFERERTESDRQELQRTAASEARRKREQQLIQDELQAKRDADEKQRQLAIEQSQAETRGKKFVADDRSLPLDERLQREREIKAQNDAAREAVRAQNEVIRQKNYVIQRENERAAEKYQRELEAERARLALPAN